MTSESETNVLADRFMRAIETGDIEAVRAAAGLPHLAQP